MTIAVDWDIKPQIKQNTLIPGHYILRQLIHLSLTCIYGPRREKTCFREFANNKGADQPAHLSSLISTFVIRLLESIIC